jgi:hypothetical protein
MKRLFFLFYIIATPLLAQYGLTKNGFLRNTSETTYTNKNGQLQGMPSLYKSGKLLNILTPNGKLNYKHYNNTSTSSYPNSDADYNSFLSGKTVDKSGTLTIPDIIYSGSYPSANLLSWSNYGDLNAVIGVSQADGFAMEITGYFIPQETGAYTFTIQGDDAVDLFIGGNFVASVYGGHGANSLGTSGTSNGTGQITLIKGVSYSFKARQQEGGGGEAFYLYWRRPSQSSGTNWYQYSNELSSVQMSRVYNIPTTNLVSYLDASNYTSYGGSGTTWTDLSSNSLNGTIYNGSYSPFNDGSIVLNGNTNSYIEIPATNLLSNQTAASFSIWFNTARNPSGNPNCILGKSTSTGSYYGLTLIVGSTGYTSTVKSTNSYGNIDNSYATSINTWYNITITIDQSSVKNYINGVLVTTSTNNSNWSMSSDVTRIGASIDPYWTGFSGKIGSVMIYNKVISASEVSQIFESQKHRFGL